MAAPAAAGSFDRLFSFEYESVPVELYRCRETGLRVALARVLSPTVHGYFAVQTEAFDDYGCPHTLEHLIFLGSDRYPYKGVLDVLANRCLAQGTNAWTDTDHTCYTVDTAGSEGFLRILPVYLDHVLFPTLKDSGFVTEVHHVTGEGANAGVVYCEMQARENEARDMTDRAMKLAAYPGRCSYKSETGGRLKELRELTNEMVRDYHKAYYRPENLCVIVTGQVDAAELCRAVGPVVEAIKQSDRIKSLPPFSKPFSTEVPKPGGPVTERLTFPAEDEKTGAMCFFAWHGPKWDELETTTALGMLLDYFTQDSIAPLRKALVETDPPLCGKVSFSMLEQMEYLFYLSLKSVDVEQLSKRDVNKEVTAVLEAFTSNNGAGIDMKRMQSLIAQSRRQHLSAVESQPHDLFSGEMIGSFMYASDFDVGGAGSDKLGDSLRNRLNKPAVLADLLQWPHERWAELCGRWMLGPASSPRVTVVGAPSKACGEKLQADDEARIKEQKEKLGPEGCRRAGEAVDKAEEENDVDTPDEVAQSFALPDVGKLGLIGVSTVVVEGAERSFREVYGDDAARIKGLISAGDPVLPAASMQFDHVSGAQFVNCHVMLPLDSLSSEQLELLPLWRDVAFELPLAASSLGPAMGYEAVVQALTDVTVSYSCSAGVDGGRFSAGRAANMLTLDIKVEKSRYAEAPFWLARIIADATFDTERLQIAAKRILNDVPNTKRNGRGLMALAMRAMSYRDDCADGAFNAFRVERVLNAMLKQGGGGVEKAATQLAAIRKALLEAPKFIRVAGDISALASTVFAPWSCAPFLASPEPQSQSGTLAPKPKLSREFFAGDAVRPPAGVTAGCLLSSSAEESNYWSVLCECFSDPRSPELAPLLVAVEYLTALEGPFWRKIRGKGLSYSYSLSHSLEAGTIRFGLFKATDPVAAFQCAAQIVQQLCSEGEDGAGGPASGGKAGDEDEDEEIGLDPSALEAAQSGVLFGLIEPVDTVPSAMDEAFTTTLSRQPPDQLHWLLKEVQGVTEDSVRAAMRAHVAPLFGGASAGRAVSLMCPARKKEGLLAELRKMKPPFEVLQLEVDDLATALAPSDGFEKLRARIAAQQGEGKASSEQSPC